MPIVSEDAFGLRRYAVFSFVEDLDALKNRRYDESGTDIDTAACSGFLKCPLTSPAEAASRLTRTELFHMKRLVSLEKGVLCPYADITFFASIDGLEEDDIKNLIGKKDCVNHYDPRIKLQKDPKRDMINTPIDADDPIGELQNGKGIKSWGTTHSDESFDANKALRGYIIIAYKTMEDMYRREFVKSWKTWTGVRYICMQLPRQLGLRRISFYRQLSQTSSFQYILCIDVSNLLIYGAHTLNLVDRIKLRLCGYVGVYREIDFKLDPATAQNLNLPIEFIAPALVVDEDKEDKPRAKDTVSRLGSRDNRSFGEHSVDETSLPGTPMPTKENALPRKSLIQEIQEGRVSKQSLLDQEPPRKESVASTKKPLKRQESQDKPEQDVPKKQSPPPKPKQRESKGRHKEKQESKESKASKKKVQQEISSGTESLTSSVDVSSLPKETSTPQTQKQDDIMRIDMETPDENQERSVEAEVHPSQNTLKPSRFAGQGRICTSGVLTNLSGQVSSDDTVPELGSRQQSISSDTSSAAAMRRQSLLNSGKIDAAKLLYSGYPPAPKKVSKESTSPKKHHVVSDLPVPPAEVQAEPPKPAYESIFKRGEGTDTLPMPDFATIAAQTKGSSYNSPVFREEWKNESAAYKGKSRGDQAMHVLADQLNLTEESDTKSSPKKKPNSGAIPKEETPERKPMISKEEKEVLAAASIIEEKIRRRSLTAAKKPDSEAPEETTARRGRFHVLAVESPGLSKEDFLNGNPAKSSGQKGIRFRLTRDDSDSDAPQHRRSIATELEFITGSSGRKHHSLHVDPSEANVYREMLSSRSPPSPNKSRRFGFSFSPHTSDEDRTRSSPRGPKKKMRPVSPNTVPDSSSIRKARSRSGSRKWKNNRTQY